MIRANKTKLFFTFLLAVLLIVFLVGMRMDRLDYQSSQLSNFLISKNAIKFIVGNHTNLTKEELEDVIVKYPNTSIMTFQNRASYRGIGLYAKKLSGYNEYVTQGRFFQKKELESGEDKVVIGKNILNSLCDNVEIEKKNSRTYAVIDEVEYEVIGVIGGNMILVWII